MSARILVVEDDTHLARSLELELNCEGYSVSVFHRGLAGLTAARETHPDLILLDLQLPDLSGLEICRRLRRTGDKTPVIVLTAKSEPQERVTGLDAGADDYVVKPFSLEELLARIRAQLRRTHESYAEVLTFTDLELNRLTREVHRGERLVELTPKEFDLLEYLIRHPRQVMTRERILEKVWGYDFMGNSNIVEAYIRYLRLKLEKAGEQRLIQTVRGIGYALRE
jgi:DNA-binding response OmpR family regulator